MKESTTNTGAEALDRAIAEWQGPIYNLAYRMLGNEADAADATQEVFLAVVRRWGRYDPSRPLKPWLFQVAVNQIRNFHRGAAARARRELEASRRDRVRSEGDPVEDDDLKQRVHEALAHLPASDRALIALHYYNELSHGEMGAVLSLPRTTVQSRLGKALERLRAALAGTGCVLSATALEAAMRGSASIEVPAGLAASLSAMPAAVGGTMTAAMLPATLGGLIMAKKVLAVAAVVVGCLALGGGAYSTGKQRGRAEMESAAAAASLREKEELRTRYEEQSRELAALRARLAEEGRAAALPRGSAADAAGELAGAEARDGGEPVPGDGGAIDWSKLSSLFAERLDLIYELSEEGNDRQPTKEERRLMAELELALKDVLSKARQLSDDPFFDERVLLGMCEAMCIPALGLSEEQAKEVRSALAKVFEERVEGFDPDTSLPAESYRVRQEFLSGMDEAVSGSMDEAQAERWRKVGALARRFLEGDRDCVSMPTAPDRAGATRETGVIAEWQKAFSLTEEQGAILQPLAAEFISRADAVRERYGQLEPAPRELTPAEKAKLWTEVLDHQIEAEKQLLRYLTPEQREVLHGRAPTILQFAPGDNAWSDRRRGSPL